MNELARTNLDEVVMIGDTMETDILGGVQLGFRTILVLSGGTTRKDLDQFAYRPDLILESLAEVPVDLNFITRMAA